MSVTMHRVMLMACLLSSCLSWPSSSWALGLGEIHLNSALNEPLNAEIDLLAATPDDMTALRATLANRDAFTRYGIDKPPFLSSLTFTVGKSKDGRDVLLVRSSDAVPEPFVTFLVDVNWAQGHLLREYTVLLDPPVYTAGASANPAPPVAAPSTPATPVPPQQAAAAAPTPPVGRPARLSETAAPPVMASDAANGIRVGKGDTLIRITRGLEPAAATPAALDQTMIALFRSNPSAFAGNINLLHQGAILRVPGADQIAALNQREAVSEVHRQMEAWRSGEAAAAAGGHLRLVPPTAGGSAAGAGNTAGGASPTGTAASAAAAAEAAALKERVNDLEAQLAESKRLIELRSSELSALQHKLAAAAAAPPPAATPAPPAAKPPVAAAPPPVAATPPVAAAPPPAAATPPATVAPPVTVPPPVAAAPPPVTAEPAASIPPPAAPPTAASGTAAKPAPPADTGSWIDWVTANWWVVLAVLALILGLLGFAAMRRRSQEQDTDLGRLMENTGVAESRETTAKLSTPRKAAESFVVEESGEHAAPDFGSASRFAEAELKSPDDTLSGEAAVNLDQGDPLAEADFHMAYGLYDQAADLVRMALEREPDRRDLRLKLLEIYFVWGNKEAFLQTAKSLEATRDRAPAGEWDKVVIMGRQICPEAPLFAATGSGRGAGAVVDLNLEGGENRVDIDLFGDPEGERSTLDPQLAETGEHASPTRESPALHGASAPLDFTLDAPERGADVSQTREMPARDEPTVESELMDFGNPDLVDAPFYAAPAEPPAIAPALHQGGAPDRIVAKPPAKADQTAEVAIDDLGLDLDHMETQTALDHPDHAGDAPTVVAGIDEHARRMMADADGIPRDGTAENTGLNARDRDLTELERELEASFVAQLDVGHDHKTAVLGPESAPTVLMPREFDGSPTTRFRTAEMGNFNDLDKLDMESTSKLRGISAENIPAESISADSIDLDLDRLASALGSGDTLEQPRSAEDLFSSDVFDATERTSKNKAVDLDVGEAMFSTETPTNKLQVQTNKLMPVEFGAQDLEPVTMSEVGTKLDLARAYMDMGDPEGARSILEEVVAEGSASQQQEASRLIESLPG